MLKSPILRNPFIVAVSSFVAVFFYWLGPNSHRMHYYCLVDGIDLHNDIQNHPLHSYHCRSLTDNYQDRVDLLQRLIYRGGDGNITESNRLIVQENNSADLHSPSTKRTTTIKRKKKTSKFKEKNEWSLSQTQKSKQQQQRIHKMTHSYDSHEQKHKKKSLLSKKNPPQKNPLKTNQNTACIRRIQREWKDAVALGIAYDWNRMETIVPKKTKQWQANVSTGTFAATTASSSSTFPTTATATKNNTTPQDDTTLFYKYNYIRIGPLGDRHKNVLRWGFSILGPAQSVYEDGVYHGILCLPKNYPGSPPRIQLFTPNGRFQTHTDICLSASAYHPELWTPRWTILSLIDALRMHFLTMPNEIGGMNASAEQRREYAKQSRTWSMGCIQHSYMISQGLFTPPPSSSSSEIRIGASVPSATRTITSGTDSQEMENVKNEERQQNFHPINQSAKEKTLENRRKRYPKPPKSKYKNNRHRSRHHIKQQGKESITVNTRSTLKSTSTILKIWKHALIKVFLNPIHILWFILSSFMLFLFHAILPSH